MVLVLVSTCSGLIVCPYVIVCVRVCVCVCVCVFVCVCVILKPNRCSLTETKKWGMWLDGGWSVLAHFCGNEDLVLMKHRQYIAIWNMKQTNAKKQICQDLWTQFLYWHVNAFFDLPGLWGQSKVTCKMQVSCYLNRLSTFGYLRWHDVVNRWSWKMSKSFGSR